MSSRIRLGLFACLLCSCNPDEGIVHRRHGDLGAGSLDGAGQSDDLSVDDAFIGATDDLGPGSYDDLAPNYGDGGQCLPPQVATMCPNALAVNAGCPAPGTGQENCGASGAGNGLDDDCNGLVDDGCPCTPGDVESCFPGPPGKHMVGACTDGKQTCRQVGEVTGWGDCVGAIAPAGESCDKLDNDCNGCIDDGLCCASAINCPAPGDARIKSVSPFTDLALKGELFFPTAAKSFSWKIVGGPCDQLFAKSTNPVVQSFTLTNGNTKDATARFTLSGDYTVTLTVVDNNNRTYTCNWVQHVSGPGLRVELCWDKTGSSTQTQVDSTMGGADLDLHLHRSGTTTKWFEDTAGTYNKDDCDYNTCTALQLPFPYGLGGYVDWGYADTDKANCSGAPAPYGTVWNTYGHCKNPRLDVDNVKKVGVPENTNVDDPTDGQSFRVMVHYFGQDGKPTASGHDVEEHPIVNIYCGGTLKTTYGQAPDTLGPCPGSTCFNHGSGWNAGQMWRVADVKVKVDATSHQVTDCTVSAIHPPATTKGYFVTVDDTSFGAPPP